MFLPNNDITNGVNVGCYLDLINVAKRVEITRGYNAEPIIHDAFVSQFQANFRRKKRFFLFRNCR